MNARRVEFNERASALEVRFESELRATPPEVLAEIATIEGVNRELRPLMVMTVPRELREQSLFSAPVGQRLFRSWLLLGGIVPVDYDDISLESVDPESGFQESSTMLSMRVWRHERRVVARSPSGSRVVDRIELVPRLAATGPLLERVVRLVFEHRHRRLRERFGEA